ncbi:MAG: sigma-54 dependent transcriptional regulator [Syntrophobacteraceae bacterium]
MRNNGIGFTLIGNTSAMTSVMNLTRRFAAANCNVLLLGPSGTGKELVARAIHHFSGRSGPFIPVNIAALPNHLVESELFGSKKGSFTGSMVDRIGRFESAHGGTIFLDEIGDIPMALQVKLLRTLQERTIQRLGENHDRPIDCRMVAATNKDLKTACKEGNFREDLYHRLAVAVIDLPPLRERTEDIPLLVDHFLEKLTPRLRPELSVPVMSNEAMDAIRGYSFPGNVRELENAISRTILLCDEELIRVEHLPENIREGVKQNSPRGNHHLVHYSWLLERITTALLSHDAGPRRSIRTEKLADIARYLSETEGSEFSRKDFEVVLRRRARHDMGRSAYATAGRYLRALIEKGVLVHNGGKANQSRFRLSEDCLLED